MKYYTAIIQYCEGNLGYYTEEYRLVSASSKKNARKAVKKEYKDYIIYAIEVHETIIGK